LVTAINKAVVNLKRPAAAGRFFMVQRFLDLFAILSDECYNSLQQLMRLFRRNPMKLFVYLFVFTCVALFICQPVTAQNLLANPSFEEWDEALPVAWLSETQVVVTQETDPVIDGVYSVGLEASTGSNRGIHQVIPVTPNEMYEYSVYLYGFSEDRSLGIFVGWLDSDGQHISGVGPYYNDDFGVYELVSTGEIEAPSDAAQARVRIRAYADEAFCGYADMAVFVPAGTQPPTPTPTTPPDPTPTPPDPTPTPSEPTPTPSDPDCLRHGDVNMDGVLTAADAQMCFLIVLGMITPTYEEECAADCNYDGVITAADAQQIFLAALGMDECNDDIP
jgi:hypothetical protein